MHCHNTYLIESHYAQRELDEANAEALEIARAEIMAELQTGKHHELVQEFLTGASNETFSAYDKAIARVLSGSENAYIQLREALNPVFEEVATHLLEVAK